MIFSVLSKFPFCGVYLSSCLDHPSSFPLVQMDAPTPRLNDFGVEASLAHPWAVDLVFITKK